MTTIPLAAARWSSPSSRDPPSSPVANSQAALPYIPCTMAPQQPPTHPAPAARLLPLLLACAVSPSTAVLTLPATPPKGFNSFDSYGGLNVTDVRGIAAAMKVQLLPHGYDILTLDGGWSTVPATKTQILDEYGRPLPDPARFPDGMASLATELKGMGLKLGLWNIRGVHIDAVNKSLKIKGTEYTFASPGLVDEQPVGGGKNGSCLWASEWLGVNQSHPAAQAYYDSRIELYAEWGVPFLKADCMMCGPCYTDEMDMYTQAVKNSPSAFMLSYSPGGGNQYASRAVQYHPHGGQFDSFWLPARTPRGGASYVW